MHLDLSSQLLCLPAYLCRLAVVAALLYCIACMRPGRSPGTRLLVCRITPSLTGLVWAGQPLFGNA